MSHRELSKQSANVLQSFGAPNMRTNVKYRSHQGLSRPNPPSLPPRSHTPPSRATARISIGPQPHPPQIQLSAIVADSSSSSSSKTVLSLENTEAMVDAAASDPSIAASVEASLAALAAQVRDMQARLALVKAAGGGASASGSAAPAAPAGPSDAAAPLRAVAQPVPSIAPSSAIKSAAGVGPKPSRIAHKSGALAKTAPGGLGL